MTKSAVRVLDPLELQSGSELSSLRSAAGHLFTGVDHVLQDSGVHHQDEGVCSACAEMMEFLLSSLSGNWNQSMFPLAFIIIIIILQAL